MAQVCINRNINEFKEISAVLKSDILTNSVITSWQSANNTDTIPTVNQAIKFHKNQKALFNLRTKDFTQSLYGNLSRLGIISKFKDDYYVVSSRNRMFDPSIRKYNLNRLYNYLRINNIPEESITRTSKGKGLTITINQDIFTPQDIIPSARSFNTPHSREVVRHLMRLFPQVQVTMLSPQKAKKIYDGLPSNKKSKVPFKDINSFYVDGMAVLIEGRVTDDTAIEEMLHPFVDSVYVENSELFNKLLKESGKSFPELMQQINDTYTERRGFSQKHRDLELVTQSLTRHFNKEFTENETKSLKDAIKEFMEWFMDFIQNLGEYLTGKPFQAKNISPNVTLTSIAKLLNTSDIQFKIEKVADKKIRYNLSPEMKVIYQNIMDKANPLQKEIIAALLHGAVHSPSMVSNLSASMKKDGAPILVLDYDTHTYHDLNNPSRQWKSTTTVISGKMSEQQKKDYKLNLELGNDFDKILEGIILEKSNQDIINEMNVLKSETTENAIKELTDYINALKGTSNSVDSAVLIPQVVVYDDATGIAGMIDLLIVNPDGTLRIIDLKTSKTGIDEGRGFGRTGTKYTQEFRNKKGELKEKYNIEKLSKEQQHNLQVNFYRRMLENMGYTITNNDNATQTFHIKVGVKGREQEQEFTGKFEIEDYYTHPLGENQPIVDLVIPKNIDQFKKEMVDELSNNSAESMQVFDLDAEDQKADKSETLPEYKVITQALRSYQKGLISKQDALVTLNKQVFLGRHKTTSELQEHILNSISAINVAIESGPIAVSRTFTNMLMDTLRQIREFKNYVEDPKNFNKPEYISYVLNFDNFMKTFKGLYVLNGVEELNATQKSLILSLQTQANDLVGVGNYENYTEGIIDKAIQDYVRTIVKNKSSRNFTESELDQLMKLGGKDINLGEFQTRDLATSKDTLLALMDKIYKAKQQELLDKMIVREKRVKRAAEKLQKLSIEKDPQKIYKFMLVFDDNNQFTGRYVQELGSKYYDIYRELRSKLFDAQGQPLQYIDITDPSTADPGDVAKNIELAKAKEAFGNFFRAETIGLNDKPISGKYHEYTKEFIDERNKWMYFKANGRHGYWVKKNNVSYNGYERFRAKYYTSGIEQEAKTYAVRDSEGNFTGKVISDVYPSTVRPQYRKPKLDIIENGKKISMRSEQYEAIMNDNTALGEAQREFYLMFKELYEDGLLNKLPKDTRDQMIGKVPLIRGRLMQDLKGKPQIFTKLFAKTTRGIKNLFRTTAEQRTLFANESGEMVDSLPIFYTGNPRSDEQLEAIDLAIDALKQDRADGKIKFRPYKEKLAELQGTRKQIESKPNLGELNMDMGNGLLKFSGMAEHFETMGEIEDTMKAMIKQIERRTYKKPKGTPSVGVRSKLGFKEVPTIKGPESATLRRAKKWMNMVYYDNDQMTKGFFDKVSDGLIKLSSYSYVAFNPFGNFNNYVLGRINDNIEAIGGRFYSKESYLRASTEFNKRAVPDMIHRLASASKKPFNKSDYDPELPSSKYEAMVDHFRMMDSQSEVRESGSDIDRIQKSWFARKVEWGYALQDAAEWNVQTKVGMAMIIDTYIRNDDTGQILSLYDAFEFDANTKGLKMKEGFKTIVKLDKKNLDKDGNPQAIRELGEYTDEFRYQLHNEIREVNKQIHGNYAHKDRVVLQAHTVGKLIFQFHKWVAPAIRARFDTEYYDENLGWMEGRYISWAKFMTYTSKQLAKGNMKFNEYTPGFLEDQGYLKDGDIQDNQKALNTLQGFYRTMGEIGMMLLTFTMKELMQAMWVDDDDENENLKRIENILIYQADRTFKELILFVPVLGMEQQYQMIKSPIASARLLGELGEALSSSIITPTFAITQSKENFYANSSVVYQRGFRKGQLKLAKEWQDVIPIMYAWKKWQNYLNMKNFFIK